jgi:hypothetical protein
MFNQRKAADFGQRNQGKIIKVFSPKKLQV